MSYPFAGLIGLRTAVQCAGFSRLRLTKGEINDFKPVLQGLLSCENILVNQGKTVAKLEFKILQGEVVVAQPDGNGAIFRPSGGDARHEADPLQSLVPPWI
jgi:hypothetical protein